MRLLLGVVLLGGAAAAQAQTVIWESPLTVGTSGGNVGYSTGTSSFGSLTTPTFSYKGRSATVTLLVTNAGGDSLVLTGSGITGSGRLTNWTLHIDDDTFAGADASTAASSYFWQTIPTWSSGLVVTVKLTTTEPGAPTGVTAMRTDATTVSLGWTAPTSIGGSAITKYQYRQKSCTGSYGSWTDILNSASLTSYDVTVQAASAAHTFQLRAVNTAGAGLWSDPAEAINPVPAAPIHVSVTAHATTTPGSIQLRWEFPFGSPSHTSIEFRASTDSGVNWNHAVTDDWPDTTEDSNDKTFLAGLTPGTAYTFEVRGRNAFGPGPAAQVTGTTAAAVSSHRGGAHLQPRDGHDLRHRRGRRGDAHVPAGR